MKQRDFKDGLDCPYCGNKAVWMTSKDFYGVDYGNTLWACKPCDARVTCHRGSYVPMGTMANAELREWRKRTHAYIDGLWKSDRMSRKHMYDTLSKTLGREIHVGWSDIEGCKSIMYAASQLWPQ